MNYRSSTFLPSLGSVQTLTVRDVFPQRDITWVTSSCTIELAVEVLSEKNILSLPVLDDSRTRVVGVIDILDIASFIVAKFPEMKVINSEVLNNLEFDGKIFGKEPVSRIVGSNPFKFFVKIDDPLAILLDILGEGTHRVPILDQDCSKVLNFVSQSDIVRYFAEHIYLLGDQSRRSLASVSTQTDSKISFVRGDLSVIAALSFMTVNKLSAVAVVNEKGGLVANFSASDLRGVKISDFYLFVQPVTTFLLNWGPRSLHPITTFPEDSIESIISKLVATRKHRLWIVDQNTLGLIGVVTMTDMTRWLGRLCSEQHA